MGPTAGMDEAAKRKVFAPDRNWTLDIQHTEHLLH